MRFVAILSGSFICKMLYVTVHGITIAINLYRHE